MDYWLLQLVQKNTDIWLTYSKKHFQEVQKKVREPPN